MSDGSLQLDTTPKITRKNVELRVLRPSRGDFAWLRNFHPPQSAKNR
jgi:hypothetical protein